MGTMKCGISLLACGVSEQSDDHAFAYCQTCRTCSIHILDHPVDLSMHTAMSLSMWPIWDHPLVNKNWVVQGCTIHMTK